MTDREQRRAEELSRFLDSEMDAAEAESFARRLKEDPELAAQWREWQANDAAIRADFAGLDDAVGALPAPSAAVPEIALPQAANDNRSWRRFAGLAIAASLAAAVFAFTLRAPGGDTALAALDDLPSGETARLAGGEAITAVLTFAADDGRWCREYAISDGRQGVACRSSEGWRIEREIARDPASSTGTGYELAQGADPQALEDVYARLGGAEPLGREEEQALIRDGWTPPAD